MWTYVSSSGNLYDPTGQPAGQGYSGHGAGVNNPAMESDPDVGPIPRGEYTIGVFFTDPEKGPIVARLTPEPETNVFGRSGFMMHGDNMAGNESASLGCIILPHSVRALVEMSGVHELVVA